ncbi:MAG: dihydroorotase [Planctomycetota bacterium]|nr:dihydroorotase [Planctomycetota bacterium]
MATFDLLLRGGTCVTSRGTRVADVGVRDGRVAEIGDLAQADAGELLDATDLHVLPGCIDPQVHFREPGFPEKEDLESGMRAAVLGGVTAILEMPNTQPTTTSRERMEDKFRRAAGRAWCDYGFFVGASPENAHELAELERIPGCPGVKIFMGSSTGSLLVADDADLARVLASGTRRCAVHAEDEDRLKARRAIAEAAGHVRAHPEWRDVECAFLATRRVVALARAAGRPLHILHVTTAEEIAFLAEQKDIATCEVPPQHLTFVAPDCYERLGTRVQMNPPIRDLRHQEGLWRGITERAVDCVASDHAPHLLEEKARVYPATPSGMPGVQTIIPLMLHYVNAGQLSLEHMVELTSAGPARIWGMEGKGRLEVGADADITVVDLACARTVTDDWIASKCGWTPLDGMELRGWPVATIVRGSVVMRDGELLGAPIGRPARFV